MLVLCLVSGVFMEGAHLHCVRAAVIQPLRLVAVHAFPRRVVELSAQVCGADPPHTCVSRIE